MFFKKSHLLLTGLLVISSLAIFAEGTINPEGPVNARGYLHFDSEEQHAAVFLDGRYKTSNTTDLLAVEPGKHHMTILTSSGKIYTKELIIKANTNSTVHLFHTAEELAAASRETYVKRISPIENPKHLTVVKDCVLVNEIQRIRAFDIFTLTPRWTYSEGLVPIMTALGDRVFIIERKRTEKGRTMHRLLELDPTSGEVMAILVSWRYSGWAIAKVGRPGALFLFDGFPVYMVPIGERKPIKIANWLPKEFKKEIIWDHLNLLPPMNLLVASRNHIFSFSAATGTTWQKRITGGIKSLLGCGDVVIIESGSSEKLALSPTSGMVKRRQISTTFSSDALFCMDGEVYGLDAPNRRIFIVDEKGVPFLNPSRELASDLSVGRTEKIWADKRGNLIIVDERGGLALWDRKIKDIVWAHDGAGPVRLIAAGGGFLSTVTAAGELVAYSPPVREEIVGWIENVINADSSARVRTIGEMKTPGRVICIPGARLPTIELDESNLLKTRILEITKVTQLEEALIEITWKDEGQGGPLSGDLLLDAGMLYLDISPTDASLWVDDGFKGSATPRALPLSPGKHRVKIVHPDRMTLVEIIDIAPGTVLIFKRALEHSFEGQLLIDSRPQGAIVSVDGEYVGKTPCAPIYYDKPGRVVDVELRKVGYKRIKRRIPIDKGQTTPDPFELEYSQAIAEIFWTYQWDLRRIIGWEADAIVEGGALGDPVLSDGSDSSMQWSAALSHRRLGPVTLFARSSIHGDGFDEVEGGLRFRIMENSRFGQAHWGLSYLETIPPTSTYITPGDPVGLPGRLSGYWDHPIAGVLVESTARRYIRLSALFRPKSRVFVELSAGLRGNARLKGNAMVWEEVPLVWGEVPLGPLSYYSWVPSNRFYDFEGRGSFLELRCKIPMRSFLRFWRLDSTASIGWQFMYSDFDFGVARERFLGMSVGLGFFVFGR